MRNYSYLCSRKVRNQRVDTQILNGIVWSLRDASKRLLKGIYKFHHRLGIPHLKGYWLYIMFGSDS